MPVTYSASGVARAASCSRGALRLYERRKLLGRIPGSSPPRYDVRAFELLKLIITLRRGGIGLAQIEKLLARAGRVEKNGTTPAPVASGLVDALHRAITDVTEQLRALTVIRAELIEARETLAVCRDCTRDFDHCLQCAEDGTLDLFSRALLLPDQVAAKAPAPVPPPSVGSEP